MEDRIVPVTEGIRYKTRNARSQRFWNKMAFALWEYIFTFLQGWILQVVLPNEAMPARDYRFKHPGFLMDYTKLGV